MHDPKAASEWQSSIRNPEVDFALDGGCRFL
jgi:hypothetical protein